MSKILHSWMLSSTQLTDTAGDFPLLSASLLGGGTLDELGLLFIPLALLGVSNKLQSLLIFAFIV